MTDTVSGSGSTNTTSLGGFFFSVKLMIEISYHIADTQKLLIDTNFTDYMEDVIVKPKGRSDYIRFSFTQKKITIETFYQNLSGTGYPSSENSYLTKGSPYPIGSYKMFL